MTKEDRFNKYIEEVEHCVAEYEGNNVHLPMDRIKLENKIGDLVMGKEFDYRKEFYKKIPVDLKENFIKWKYPSLDWALR